LNSNAGHRDEIQGTHFLSGITETDQLVQKLKANAHKRLTLSPRTTSLPLANKVNCELIKVILTSF
jgi:hypothetical protein